MNPDPFSLKGKTAIVTGSTRGIGLGIAEQFCQAGASCVITSENADAVAIRTAELTEAGYPVVGQPGDVSSPEDLAKLVETAVTTFGALDILVCNAGITGTAGPNTAVDPNDYARVFEVNLHSMVALTNLAYPALKERGGGSIILLSSIAGLRGNATISAYALAKAGVAQLARNLAVQWGPMNIRTNAISPGLIRTELSDRLMNNDAFMERRMQMTPLRRPGVVSEVAACAVFLASEAGGFVTGHNLVVDGGTTITDGS
ncbi:MAG: SDR family NAD(P)-dependent oxidoreductase [Gammaproteobacteria bacterium]